MKTTQSKLKMLVFFFVAVAGFLLINSSSAFATAKTWTGAAEDNKLATAGNWSPSGSPVTGDTLTISFATLFGSSCSADSTLNNDIDSTNVTLAGVTFNGTMPTDCYYAVVISGNGFKLSGDITSTRRVSLQSGVTATGDIEISNIASSSLLQTGNNSVTLSQLTQFSSVSGGGTLILGDEYEGGSGGGCGDGTGSSYPVTGDGSAFTGAIISNGISLGISSRSNDIARHASQITINSTGNLRFSLNYHEDMTFDGKIVFNGGSVYAFQSATTSGDNCLSATVMKDVNLTGEVQINQITTFSPYMVNIKLGDQVTGADNARVAKGVTGQITLPSGSVVSSEIDVHTIDSVDDCNSIYAYAGNKSIVNVDCSSSYVAVNGGILAGSGKLGAVTVSNGGIIAPGNSPGVLSTSDLTFEEGGIYEFEIAGNSEGQYDQINVTGTVTLGNGTLRAILLDGFKPEQGKSFVIINNDGSDAVAGVFAGLSQGATVEVDGVGYFTISYTGGDGNDVTLTAIPGVGNAGDFKQSASLGFVVMGAVVVASVAIKARKLILK